MEWKTAKTIASILENEEVIDVALQIRKRDAPSQGIIDRSMIDLSFILFQLDLLKYTDHFDREILLALIGGSFSAMGIARVTGLNRKTVRTRLKKLKRLNLVSEKPSKNSKFMLTEEFLHMLLKTVKMLIHWTRNEENYPQVI